jgi:hypothetical protein
MRTARSWAFVLILLGLVACAGTAPTGSLYVVIGGLPAGVPAAVEIVGPNGHAEVVTSTRLLANLVPGAYTLTPADVADGHPIVPDTYDATASLSARHGRGGRRHDSDVDYVRRSPTGRAWVSRTEDEGPILSGFDGDDLLATGAPAPAASVGRDSGMWEGIAFDAHGNAWIARYQHGTRLVRFPAAHPRRIGPHGSRRRHRRHRPAGPSRSRWGSHSMPKAACGWPASTRTPSSAMRHRSSRLPVARRRRSSSPPRPEACRARPASPSMPSAPCGWRTGQRQRRRLREREAWRQRRPGTRRRDHLDVGPPVRTVRLGLRPEREPVGFGALERGGAVRASNCRRAAHPHRRRG